MEISDTIHHEKLSELYAYWKKIQGSRDIPARSDFDPLDIPHLLENIILLDVERDPLRFRVRVHGTALVKLRGRDLTGHYLDEPDISEGADVSALANIKVVETKQPHYTAAPFPPASGGPTHFYRLELPLSTNGTDVDKIIVGFYQDIDSKRLFFIDRWNAIILASKKFLKIYQTRFETDV